MGKRPKENIVTVEIHMNKIFKMDPVFYGSKTEILIYEKKMLIEYYYKHHELPPGNKRFH